MEVNEWFRSERIIIASDLIMEEEDMEDVCLDEKVVGTKDEMKMKATEKGEVMEAEKVENGNEDQVLAALGNIGRWQVQIIMITGQDM